MTVRGRHALRAVGPRTLLLLRRAAREFTADHCPQMAAAISYHLLFSLFPLAIAGVAVLGLFTSDPATRDSVVRHVVDVVPLSETGRGQLQDQLARVSGGSGALGLLGLVGVLWSASGVMAAVRTALNVAWDTTRKRPFLRGKAVDLLLVGATFLVVAVALAVTVASNVARQQSQRLPGPLELLAGGAAAVGAVLAALAVLFGVFLFLYAVVPAASTPVSAVWPGALVAAVGFEAVQYGFSLYVAYFAHYNKVYGSLGAVIAFLFYVYLASAAFLFGAEVASEYPRLAEPDRVAA